MKHNLSSLCFSFAVLVHPSFSFSSVFPPSSAFLLFMRLCLLTYAVWGGKYVEPYITEEKVYAKGKTINDVDARDAVRLKCIWCSKVPWKWKSASKPRLLGHMCVMSLLAPNDDLSTAENKHCRGRNNGIINYGLGGESAYMMLWRMIRNFTSGSLENKREHTQNFRHLIETECGPSKYEPPRLFSFFTSRKWRTDRFLGVLTSLFIARQYDVRRRIYSEHISRNYMTSKIYKVRPII